MASITTCTLPLFSVLKGITISIDKDFDFATGFSPVNPIGKFSGKEYLTQNVHLKSKRLQ